MAYMLKSTLQKNCTKHVILFCLFLITCTLACILLNFQLTSMDNSIRKEEYASNAKYPSLQFPVTRAVTYSKLQTDMVASKGKDDQHGFVSSGRVHYFRCADPIGRLGNMMFQLAASVGIAHTMGYTPYISPSHVLEKYFDTGITRNINVTNEITFDERLCRNRTWIYNKVYLSHNLTAWGYLQSWKYFENSNDAVRKAFTFREKFINEARAFLRLPTESGRVLIGVHIRRGDFVTEYFTELGFTAADGNYTQKAIDWYRKKSDRCLFVVVSDDIPWCKDNIKGDDVIYSNSTEGIVDLAILSLCHHSIITGGTFGWWGGWLAGGTVIYLADYPRPGTWLWDNLETKTDLYYPLHWIGMRNGKS